ncbi:MAG: SDR family oxidoreductase [Betaproteobacteria bacterium]|nr:SDR family oxidoreductase [Betaproteobacteria bacterium]
MKAIVTGHSRGLGAAIAEALLGREIPVLGLARAGNPGLAARFPDTLAEVAIDLADNAALERWLAEGELAAFIAGSGPALLVNNAGALAPMGLTGTLAPAAIAHSVTLNVAAPLILANAFAATRSDSAERRILHISSGAARTPYPGWNIYCATKAALDHHARAVAAEAIPGLRIASVAPGVVDTDMQAEIRATDNSRFPLRDRFVAMQAQGYLTPPEAAARTLVDWALGDAFGREPTADVRELPAP